MNRISERERERVGKFVSSRVGKQELSFLRLITLPKAVDHNLSNTRSLTGFHSRYIMLRDAHISSSVTPTLYIYLPVIYLHASNSERGPVICAISQGIN